MICCSTFMESYGVDTKKTEAIDRMQQEFSCCGSSSFEDWAGSRWMLEKHNNDNKVPDSCCKTEGPGCGVRDHPSNIYYTGCIHRLSDTVRNHFGYHTIAGLGLCILQVIGVIFSTCLYSKLKDAEVADL
jgi:CD151 antigen